MEGRNWCKSFPFCLLQQLFWETGYRTLGYGALNLHLAVLNLECILQSSLGLLFSFPVTQRLEIQVQGFMEVTLPSALTYRITQVWWPRLISTPSSATSRLGTCARLDFPPQITRKHSQEQSLKPHNQGLRPQIYHCLAVWPWASISFLCLSVPIYQMYIIPLS